MCELLSELHTINYKGIITSINYRLGYFTLDGSINVLICFKYKNGGSIQIPLVNEQVMVTNACMINKNTFVLTEESEIHSEKRNGSKNGIDGGETIFHVERNRSCSKTISNDDKTLGISKSDSELGDVDRKSCNGSKNGVDGGGTSCDELRNRNDKCDINLSETIGCNENNYIEYNKCDGNGRCDENSRYDENNKCDGNGDENSDENKCDENKCDESNEYIKYKCDKDNKFDENGCDENKCDGNVDCDNIDNINCDNSANCGDNMNYVVCKENMKKDCHKNCKKNTNENFDNDKNINHVKTCGKCKNCAYVDCKNKTNTKNVNYQDFDRNNCNENNEDDSRNFYNITSCTNFIRKITEYDLNIPEVLQLINLFEKFSNLGVFPESFLKTLDSPELHLEEILISIISIYKRLNWDFRIRLKTPRFFRSDTFYGKRIECNPNYIFGIQKNLEDHLFGYLTFDTERNYLSLVDGLHSIACVTDDNSKNYNKFVFVKKYRVVTEYFQECIVEYLYFKMEDVISCDGVNKTISDVNPNTFKCTVIQKGPVSNNVYWNEPECWLHVTLENDIVTDCLITSKKFIKLYPLIQNGSKLVITLPDDSKRLRTVNNCELQRLFPNLSCHVLPPNIRIDIIDRNVNKNIPMLSDLNDKNDRPITFVAVIYEKILTTPLPSRTKVTDEKRLYGTPGSKTHTIKLRDIKNMNVKKYLYLNNWENVMNPLGLIPDMVVIVQYVLQHKNYFKSSALTNFEIVDFKPRIDYSTTKYFRKNIDWGSLNTFSIGHTLPENVICWCTINHIEMKTLKIKTLCKFCNKFVKQFQETCCEKTDFDLRISSSFITEDYGGKAEIFTTDLNVLKTILGFDKQRWKVVLIALRQIKDYDFTVIDTGEFSMNDPITTFINTFTFMLNSIKSFQSIIDLKCRNKTNNEEVSKWFCLEARRR